MPVWPKIRELSERIADSQHLNVAIEPRVSAREIAEFTNDGFARHASFVGLIDG